MSIQIVKAFQAILSQQVMHEQTALAAKDFFFFAEGVIGTRFAAMKTVAAFRTPNRFRTKRGNGKAGPGWPNQGLR
jgi:hypothetical protein